MPDSKKIDAWNPILFVAIALNEAKGACLGWDPPFLGHPAITLLAELLPTTFAPCSPVPEHRISTPSNTNQEPHGKAENVDTLASFQQIMMVVTKKL